jgi:agmatine/peptidylarginine deiminase
MGFISPPDALIVRCWMAWPSRDDQPQHAADARAQCGSNIEIITLPIDDPWMRGSGPTFITQQQPA